VSYRTSVIFETSLLSWQQLTLEDAAAAWSDEYRVAGPRLLLPLTSCLGFRIAADTFLCDAATAVFLTPEQPYRMRRPYAAQRSMLITVAGDLGPGGRSTFPLASHLKLRRWMRAARGRQVDTLALEEGLLGLARDASPARATVPARSHRASEAAREYIASCPERDDSLREIAAAVHVSPYHLARVFRRCTGQSLHGYRTRLRMTAALDRLQQGENDLSALAADLGYSSHSHFGAVFLRNFGASPGQLRTNLAARNGPT
jgi:AraC family transcriptional regulator